MGDVEYIRDVVIPEFLQQFTSDNAEYPPERPLGAKAEWHGIHRKVGKLKAPVWDGKPWTGRESVRRMFLEIAGHAFLAVASLDEETSPEISMQEPTEVPPEQPVTLTDLLRRNLERAWPFGPIVPVVPVVPMVNYLDPNPLIGMTEEGKRRLRRMRAEQAGHAQLDKPL